MSVTRIYLYYIKNDYSPQPNGGGYWSYRLMISYDADAEFSRIFEIHTRCEAPSPSAKRERGYSETLLASGTSAAP